MPQRRAFTFLAAALAGAACHSSTTVTGPGATPPPAPPSASTGPAAFTIRCEPVSFQSCGSSTCRISAVEAVSVALTCSTDSSWLTCGVGPGALVLGAGESRSVGLTMIADPLGPGGRTGVSVVGRGGGQVQRGDVAMLVGSSPVREPRPGTMMVVGCAGYVAGVLGPDQVQYFGGPIAGAWRTAIGPRGVVCAETHSGSGFFELEVPPACGPEGSPVILSAGGLNTCVTVPFAAGKKAHAVLLGRWEASCP